MMSEDFIEELRRNVKLHKNDGSLIDPRPVK